MEVTWSNFSAEAGSFRVGRPGPGEFLISSRMNTPQSLWVTRSNAVTLALQKCFLMYKWSLLCFSLCPLALFFSLERTWLHLYPPIGYLINWWDVFELSLLLAKLPDFSAEMLQPLYQFSCLLMDFLQYVHVSFVLKNPKLQMWPRQCWLLREYSLMAPLLMQPRIPLIQGHFVDSNSTW